MLVILVPMFAPITTGMAWFSSITPAATRLTTMEVEVEEDWTSTVAMMPVISPAIGLSIILKRSWVLHAVSS